MHYLIFIFATLFKCQEDERFSIKGIPGQIFFLHESEKNEWVKVLDRLRRCICSAEDVIDSLTPSSYMLQVQSTSVSKPQSFNIPRSVCIGRDLFLTFPLRPQELHFTFLLERLFICIVSTLEVPILTASRVWEGLKGGQVVSFPHYSPFNAIQREDEREEGKQTYFPIIIILWSTNRRKWMEGRKDSHFQFRTVKGKEAPYSY